MYLRWTNICTRPTRPVQNYHPSVSNQVIYLYDDSYSVFVSIPRAIPGLETCLDIGLDKGSSYPRYCIS